MLLYGMTPGNADAVCISRARDITCTVRQPILLVFMVQHWHPRCVCVAEVIVKQAGVAVQCSANPVLTQLQVNLPLHCCLLLLTLLDN